MAGSQGASVADSCQVTYGRPSLLAALLLPLFAWSQQGSLKISTPSVPPQIERDARIPHAQSQPTGAAAMLRSELRDEYT